MTDYARLRLAARAGALAEEQEAVRAQLARQVAHWTLAAEELADLGALASEFGWASLERYLGSALRETLRAAVERLARHGAVLAAELQAVESPRDLRALGAKVVHFRRRYLATEAVLDFYGDAVNTRTSAQLGAALRACDVLATRSMASVLEPLGKRVPRVLTALTTGRGAKILKAGLPLWDRSSVSPVATIQVARNNLYRPTALCHEAGHQIAHETGWTAELADALRTGLARNAAALGALWSGWASEIAADAFAFVQTGYAAVANLHDVISGDSASVLGIAALDPHPTGYVRILLGREMCRRFFGAGPWDPLARAWIATHPLERAANGAAELLADSTRALPEVVELVLERRYRAFGGRSLVQIVDPARVRPEALLELERSAGPSLYASSHWLDRECLRLLALSGYRLANEPARVREILKQQEDWMLRLGSLPLAA
jgi:hypothetical protein